MDGHKDTAKLLSMRNVMIFVYSVLAAMLFAFTCLYFFFSSERALKTQSEHYTTMAAQQSATSVNNFLNNVRHSARIIYDDSRLVSFYPAGEQLTGEELETAAEISELLTKASYSADYADLGVIYEGGHKAGIVSDGTVDLLGADYYARAVEILDGRETGWAVFYSGNLSRASYFKRLNSHAITISSVYASKLNRIFSKLISPSNLSLIVADDNDRVIYASENTQYSAGDHIDAAVTERFDGRQDITIGTDDECFCLIGLENGWHMYSLVKAVKQSAKVFGMTTANFILITSLSALLIFILAGMTITAFYTSDKHARSVTEYETDPELGVLTPFYCEETVSDLIETSMVGGTWAFTLVKIKDIDLMRERLGDDFVRSGQVKLAQLLKQGFGEETAIGLNSSGEFVVFSDFSDFDIFKAHESLKSKHEEVRKLFSELLVGDDADIKLDVAIGVCVYPDHGKDYEELEYKAGAALDKALSLDKDSVVFFEEKAKAGGDRR